MTQNDLRKHVRVNSLNLLNYVYFGEDKETGSQGMGRTLNLSEAGLLMETNSSFRENVEVSIDIGLQNTILSVNGKVVYTDVDDSGLSRSGIHFENIGIDEFILLRNYLHASMQ